MIVQAGSYQRFIGKLTLVFNRNSVEAKSDTLIAMESLHGSDMAIEKLADKYENNPEFEKVAGIAVSPINGKQDLGALMTDAMAWASKTDIAFQKSGRDQNTKYTGRRNKSERYLSPRSFWKSGSHL